MTTGSRYGLGVFLLIVLGVAFQAHAAVTLFFSPEWAGKGPQVKAITDAISQKSELEVRPQIAQSYQELLAAAARKDPILIYGGSFVQAMLCNRELASPLVQGLSGKEFYVSILIAPESAGENPVAIVKDAGAEIAYSKASSSGESGAMAASAGKASVETKTHLASANAVKAGRAKAAFVKNWWWEANKDKFPTLRGRLYPWVSEQKNPDNVLSANKAVAADDLAKLKKAILECAEPFGVKSFAEVDTRTLQPSLELMKRGGIDPNNYKW